MQLRFKQNVAWALAEVITSGLILFFLYRIIVKILGVEALGIWSLVMATTSLGRLADIGTAAGLGRFVAASRAKHEDIKALGYAETALLTNLILYLGIAAIIWAPAYYWLSIVTTGESLVKARELLPYALISFILMSVTAAATGALVGQQRSDQRSMITIASLFVQFSVALLFVPRYGLPALAWAQTAQYLVIVCASWALFLRNHFGVWTFRIPLRWRLEILKELIGYGVKLQALSIVSFFYEPSVKFLMSSLGGLEALGFYEMAQRLVLQIRQLVVMPNQTLVPGFAHLKECEPERIEPLYHKAMALSILFGLPMLAGVAVASPLICAVWIGHIESLFVIFTILLSVGWFANLLAAPAYLLGVALGRLRWNLYGTIVTTFGAALLSFIFGHIFGKFGVAVPAIAMLGAGSLLTMVMNCRTLQVQLFPASHDFHTLLNEARSYLKKHDFREFLQVMRSPTKQSKTKQGSKDYGDSNINKVIYVSEGEDGHHAEYNRLFLAIFKEMHIHVDCVSDACRANAGQAPLFHSMIDRSPAEIFSTLTRTIARSILGRKTVGLFFRPAACLHATTLKHKIKNILFRFTAHLPHVSILTILPFDICPDFSKIATNGIYDPQLWDLKYFEVPVNGAPHLKQQVELAAQGRRIVVALGSQNTSKGFDYMVDLWSSSSKIRDALLFVVAGKISADSQGKAKQFEENGGFLLNRRIDNDELFGLYQMANIVWSCYAPQYNQASGIHGRAVQLGVPVVVRKGSYIEKLGAMIGHPTLAISFADLQKAADQLLAWRPSHTNEETRTQMVNKMRKHSLAILTEAIGAVHPAQKN